AGDLLRPVTVSAGLHAEATTVQFPGLDGVLPGYGVQRPNDWGLGFELRDAKSPHWTGARNSARTYGHFGQAGGFIWADPEIELALVVL
ncbi:serine hydrolase, partial [Mycobacterium tuberculosis]